MGKRLITGIAYLAVLIGFFLMKILIRPEWLGMLLFDGLVVLFSAVGTYEMLRAIGDKAKISEKIVTGIFSTGTIVAYAVSDAVYKVLREESIEVVNYSPNIAFVVFVAGLAILFSLLVFSHGEYSLESVGYSLLAYVYPSVFLMVLAGCNHMPNFDFSAQSILYVFAICPFADTFAYVFGRLFGKKLPKKMAPSISPNKTVIGGIGGVLGGAIGAVVIYFVYYAIKGAIAVNWVDMVFFIGLGILTALFAEFGDLVESAIKRKFGIKDMGKILPGHGGILDRIDSTLFASLIVCFVFSIRILISG